MIDPSIAIHAPEEEPITVNLETTSTLSPETAILIESSFTAAEVLVVSTEFQEVTAASLDTPSISIELVTSSAPEVTSVESLRREEPMSTHFETTQQALPQLLASTTQSIPESLPKEPSLANEPVISEIASFRPEGQHSPVISVPLPLESLPIAEPVVPSELEEQFKRIVEDLGNNTNTHLNLQRHAILQLKKVIPLVHTEQEEQMLVDALPKLYRWVRKHHVIILSCLDGATGVQFSLRNIPHDSVQAP